MRSLKSRLVSGLTVCLTAAAFASDDLPKTLMTERGKLLVSEDFTKLPVLSKDKPLNFASGFNGWIYTSGSAVGRSGRWELCDSAFRGIENPEAHHPATASYGIRFQDAIIQCQMKLGEAPAKGMPDPYMQIKATDSKDYVCVLTFSQSGLVGKPFDDAHTDPVTKQRAEGTATKLRQPIKPGEWHTVVMEIKGKEIVGTLDGKSITFSNPLIGANKHCIKFVARTEGSIRAFRVWEALPNADWPKNKVALQSEGSPSSN